METEFNPRDVSAGKDKEIDGIIRPQGLEEFSGQDKIIRNLKIFVAAAKMRGRLSTTSFSTDLLVLERPLLHILLPMNSGLT